MTRLNKLEVSDLIHMKQMSLYRELSHGKLLKSICFLAFMICAVPQYSEANGSVQFASGYSSFSTVDLEVGAIIGPDSKGEEKLVFGPDLIGGIGISGTKILGGLGVGGIGGIPISFAGLVGYAKPWDDDGYKIVGLRLGAAIKIAFYRQISGEGFDFEIGIGF